MSRVYTVLKHYIVTNVRFQEKKYTFKKTNGEYYSEAHHLIPLGKGGSDLIGSMLAEFRETPDNGYDVGRRVERYVIQTGSVYRSG